MSAVFTESLHHQRSGLSVVVNHPWDADVVTAPERVYVEVVWTAQAGGRLYLTVSGGPSNDFRVVVDLPMQTGQARRYYGMHFCRDQICC
jgi:hypothetical protein